MRASSMRGRLVIEYGELSLLAQHARDDGETNVAHDLEHAADLTLKAFDRLENAAGPAGTVDDSGIYPPGRVERA